MNVTVAWIKNTCKKISLYICSKSTYD